MAIAIENERPDGIQRGRGGFMRSIDGKPYVTDPTGSTTKHDGNKPELLALCAERGIEVPVKVTVAQLHELLGGRPKRLAYGSPSNRGMQIENSTNLTKWGERRVVLGVGLDPEIGRMCQQLIGLDVDSEEYKTLADSIIVRAKEIAKANLAAQQGTHVHALTEDSDEARDWVQRAEAGEIIGLDRELQAALVDGWNRMLKRFNLTVLAVEASVVDDAWHLAGTLDRIVRLGQPLRFRKLTGEIIEIPADLVVVGDVKTSNMRLDRNGYVQYWQPYAIQIASYAQSVPYDTTTEQRGEWPFEISQEHALIFHPDLDTCEWELIYCDLVAGREHGGECVVAAKAWEARTDVFSVAQVPIEEVKSCSIDGCNRPVLALGMCDPHYRRDRRHGDPTAGRPTFAGDGAKAFAELVLIESDECVLWPYGKTNRGYGQLLVDGENCSTHVLACEQHHGPRPSPDHEVAHSCGVRHCLNKRHLRWATHAENEADKLIHGTSNRGRSIAQLEVGDERTDQLVDDAEVSGGIGPMDPAAYVADLNVNTPHAPHSPEVSPPDPVTATAGAGAAPSAAPARSLSSDSRRQATGPDALPGQRQEGRPSPGTARSALAGPDPERIVLVDARAQLPTDVDEGADLSGAEYGEGWAVLQRHYSALDPAAKSWLAGLIIESIKRGLSFHAKHQRSLRVFELYRGLIFLCEAGGDQDELLRALLALVIGDVALFPAIHPGHAVGALGAAEAATFADLVTRYNADELVGHVDDDGTFRLVA